MEFEFKINGSLRDEDDCNDVKALLNLQHLEDVICEAQGRIRAILKYEEVNEECEEYLIEIRDLLSVDYLV